MEPLLMTVLAAEMDASIVVVVAIAIAGIQIVHNSRRSAETMAPPVPLRVAVVLSAGVAC